MNDSRVEILHEKFVTLDNKVTAFHSRVDKVELLISNDLREIKIDFKELTTELKDVTAWMHRSQGWASASKYIAGALGATFGFLLGFLAQVLHLWKG